MKTGPASVFDAPSDERFSPVIATTAPTAAAARIPPMTSRIVLF